MKLFRIYVFILLNLLPVFNLIASNRNLVKGYIITLEKDTIYGLIQNNGFVTNSKVCYFYNNEDETPHEYLPGSINSYRFIDGKYYISKEILIDSIPSTIFLEYLIDGKVDIYYLVEADRDRFFIQKDSGDIFPLDTKTNYFVWDDRKSTWVRSNNETILKTSEYDQYKGVLKYVMSDAPELFTDIDKLNLIKKPVISIAKDYHNKICNEYNCVIYEKGFNPYYKLGAGFAFGYFNFEGDEDLGGESLLTGNAQNLSLTFSRSLENINEKSSIKLSFFISNFSTAKDDGRYTYSFNAKHMMLPLQYQYTLSGLKFKPYIGLGVVYNKFIDLEITSQIISTTHEYEPRRLLTAEKHYNDTFLGGFASAGFEYYLYKGIYLDFTGAGAYSFSKFHYFWGLIAQVHACYKF